jgi:sn-glycerol 3-phosphate transport system substrate-binding protein
MGASFIGGVSMSERTHRIIAVIVLLLSAALAWAGGSQEAGETEAAMQEEPTELQFWYAFSDEPRSNWIQERIAEWNEMNPEYTMVGERKGSYRETLQAAVLAARQGEPPHAVQLFEVGSQLAYDSGIFKPVGEIGTFSTSDYIEPVLNYYTIDSEVHSIPFNSSSPILYTNKDMMQEAGLNPNDPPETYGEVIAALEQARAAGVENARIGFNLHSWFYEQWMAEQGAPLVNNDNGRSARATETMLDSAASKRIVSWIKELNDNGYYTYTGKLEDWGGSDAIFQEERAMFHITSTADVGNIASAVEGKFDMGTGRLPIPDGVDRNGVVIGGASIWVLDGHSEEDLEATRDFVLYMTNTENMVSWHKLTGYYPVRDSSIDALEDEGWFQTNPERTIAFTQLTETVPNTATAGALMGSFLETRTIIEEAIQKVLNGESVDSAMDEAKRLADARLEEYNANVQ